MSEFPLVTLIVPVFNVERYLTQCLESIGNQEYQNLEILIIDDGSSDESGNICDHYALMDSRAKVFHTENHGLAIARNLGLDNANGVYIAFLDSDDWMEPYTIRRLVECALEYDSEIVAGGVSRVWVNKTEIASMPQEITTYDGEEALSELVCEGYLRQFVWNKLYCSRCFSELRFPKDHLHEDMYVTYHLLYTAKKVVFLPEVMFHYRMRKSGICNTKSLKRLVDYWQAWHDMYEFLKQVGKPYRDNCLHQSLLAGALIWFQYTHLSKSEAKENSNNLELIIEKISGFALEHAFEVMKGDYALIDKLLCIMMLCKSKLYMSLLYRLYVNRKFLKVKSHDSELAILYD